MNLLREQPEPQNSVLADAVPAPDLSVAARQRLLSRRGDPLFLGDWMRVLMIHFAFRPATLQPHVPYPLDCRDGWAFVTLVAFSLAHLRPCRGGRLGAWLLRPIATHDFLNVRTYVQHRGEAGIHFLAEWLTSWLAVQLGPRTFSLPYRHGRIHYDHDWRTGRLAGRIADASTAAFSYQATVSTQASPSPCARGSLAEWLMERYTAFNALGNRRRFFRVWHPPWPQCEADVQVVDQRLLLENWECFREAKLVGANFSPGLQDVWMGRPHRA